MLSRLLADPLDRIHVRDPEQQTRASRLCAGVVAEEALDIPLEPTLQVLVGLARRSNWFSAK